MFNCKRLLDYIPIYSSLINMAEWNMNLYFKLRKIDDTFWSAFTGFVSVSILASLGGIPIGILTGISMSSAVGFVH